MTGRLSCEYTLDLMEADIIALIRKQYKIPDDFSINLTGINHGQAVISRKVDFDLKHFEKINPFIVTIEGKEHESGASK